jgi:hypothetical protein
MGDGVEPADRGTRTAPVRAVTFVVGLAALLVLTMTVDWVTSFVDGTQPAPRTSVPAVPRPLRTWPDASPRPRIESARTALGGLLLAGTGQMHPRVLARRDVGAVRGPWSIVVRSAGGSLARASVVLTFPVPAAAGVSSRGWGAPPAVVSRGVVQWHTAHGWARVRGDVPTAELMAVARRMTVVAGHPVVPAGRWGALAYRGPQRQPMVHEVQVGGEQAGYGRTFAGGVLFSGVTTGGGLEDALFRLGARPAGRVHGRPAVLSASLHGDIVLAWEPSAGVIAYVGYGGTAPSSRSTVVALREVAERAVAVSPRAWLALHPELVDAVNDTPDVRQRCTRGAARDRPVTGEVAVSAGIWSHPW